MSARDLRAKLGLNQTDFWGRLGVTQSAGSRYEGGRDIPAPTQSLLDLTYGSKPLAALAKLRGCKVSELK